MLKPILIAIFAVLIFAAAVCIAQTQRFEVRLAVRHPTPDNTAVEFLVGSSLRRPN